MTKAELVALITHQTGVEKTAAEAVVEAFMRNIKETMIAGEDVFLRGFGSFIVKERAEKVARNITKNTTMVIQIQYQTPKIYTVLPIDTLQGTQVKDGFLKISTIRRRVSLDMSRTTASDFYASVNLGLCFCRSETEPPHLQRTLLGPILPQRVIIVRKYGLNKVYYLMKSPERRSRITK